MAKGHLQFVDTFNDRVISTHRTPKGAAKAEFALHRRFARNNTHGSYLPTDIRGFRSDSERAEYEYESDQLAKWSRSIGRVN